MSGTEEERRLGKLEKLLDRLDRRVDDIEKSVLELKFLERLEVRMNDHDTRLRGVEQSIIKLMVIASIASAIGAIVGSVLIKSIL